MLEENKSPEVELDTDGIKEQSVEIENKTEESNEPQLPKEEVDLGYTESKPEGIEKISVEETEDKKEETKDDLGSISESVQKRINKINF